MAPKAKKHGRRCARESALALLYSSDITEQDVVRIVEEGSYPADDVELPAYAEALVRGVHAHRAALDDYLASTSENWAIDRMPVVDRAILRLATYEMLYVDEVPVSVTISEAVDLAKAYGGGDESPRFVNGVLGRIALKLEAEAAATTAGAADAGGFDEAAGNDASDDETAGAADAPAGAEAAGEAVGVSVAEKAASVDPFIPAGGE